VLPSGPNPSWSGSAVRMPNSCPPKTICKTTLKTTRTTPCRALGSFALIAAVVVAVAGCSSTPLVTPKERVTIKALLTPTIAGTLSDNGAAMAQSDAVTALACDLSQPESTRCQGEAYSAVSRANPS